jgi:two-component system, cell cycle sensor histidine kinase and response regulator CckA
MTGKTCEMEGVSGMGARAGGEEKDFYTEMWYQNLFKSFGMAMFLVDPETRIITDVNRAACRFYGYDEERMIGMPISEINPSPPYELYEPSSREKFKKGLRFIRTHRLANGEMRTVSLYNGLVEISGETRVISMVHDITDIIRARDAMRTEREFRRAIEDSMLAGVASCDREGRFTTVNNAFCEMIGWSREELIGLAPPYEFWPWSHTEEFGDEFSKVIRGETTEVRYDKQLVSRKKNVIDVMILVSLLLDDSGNIRGLVGVFHDQTERNRLREQVEIRSRMDSLGTLSAGIAHDFNNLLTAIMGNISLIEMSARESRQPDIQSIRDAKKSCEKAAELIRMFQIFAGGYMRGDRILDVRDQVVQTFRDLNVPKGRTIDLVVDIEPGRFFVNTETLVLEQAFRNILVNAVEAIEAKGTPPGSAIRITAETHFVSPSEAATVREGEYIHIRFADNGIGMSDEVRRRAFEPMFSTKRMNSRKGQGLGLAIVYALLTRNKGFAEIESVVGEGTTVHLFLPNAAEQER